MTKIIGKITSAQIVGKIDGKASQVSINAHNTSETAHADIRGQLSAIVNEGATSANNVSYDNQTSGLTSTNVQSAIDEVAAGGGEPSAEEVEQARVDGDGTTFASLKERLDTKDGVVVSHLAQNANQAHGGAKGVLLAKNVAQSISSATALTTLTWQVKSYEDGGIFYDGATPERIIIPAGVTKVKVSSGLLFVINSTSGYCSTQIYKNGGTDYDGRAALTFPNANAAMGLNVISPVLEVVEGDYFDVRVAQVTGSSKDIASATGTWFALEVIE